MITKPPYKTRLILTFWTVSEREFHPRTPFVGAQFLTSGSFDQKCKRSGPAPSVCPTVKRVGEEASGSREREC